MSYSRFQFPINTRYLLRGQFEVGSDISNPVLSDQHALGAPKPPEGSIGGKVRTAHFPHNTHTWDIVHIVSMCQCSFKNLREGERRKEKEEEREGVREGGRRRKERKGRGRGKKRKRGRVKEELTEKEEEEEGDRGKDKDNGVEEEER